MADGRGLQGLGLLALMLAGCSGKVSNVLEEDDGPDDEGGGIITMPEDPVWGCAQRPRYDAEGGPKEATFRLGNILGSRPVAGATALLCSKADPDCHEPLEKNVTDEEGAVTFQVPYDFTGYAWFVSDSESASSLYYLQPGDDYSLGPRAVQLAGPSLLASLTTMLGSPQKDGNALVLASAFDCTGNAAEGVRFSPRLAVDDSEVVLFYLKGGIPDQTITQTDASGAGGLANVEPGVVSLEATRWNGGPVSTVAFLTKPNTTTIVRLLPGR